MPTSYINPSPSGETEGGRFSIIIPHKGPQWQLDRCVASVPKRDDLQIIVIHDEETQTEEHRKDAIHLAT